MNRESPSQVSSASAERHAALGHAVLLLSFAAFASAAALRVCDAMLPALALDFGTSVGNVARVVTAASVTYGLCQFLFGPLGDHFGKLRVIAWACIASTLAAVACTASLRLDALVAARALTGAATAALIPLSMAWIGDAVPFHERQHTLARFMSGQIVGMLSGQVGGGFFADLLGWRWAFAALAAAYLAAGVLLLRALPRLDAVPSTQAGPAGAPMRMQDRIRLVAGAHGVGAAFATVFIESMLTFGVLAFIPTFLHQRFGISLVHAGGVVAAFGLGGLFYTLFARRWVRALGQRGLVLAGGALMGAAWLALALGTHWAWGALASAVAGLGFYQFHNTLQTRATQLVPAARGTAVSLFASCFFLGQAAGVALAAVAVDHSGTAWLFGAAACGLPLLGWSFRGHLARSAARH